MAVQIKFDSSHNPIQPTIVLTTRNGRKLGKIPARNVVFKASMNDGFDMSFKVYREECPQLWESITDFKCVWAKEWNQLFEIEVETDDDGSLMKSVTAVSLGKAELSQIKLYEKEINTETDIARDDFEPTVFFNEAKPEASLLHRLLEKAPHYRVGHVDTSLKNIQRTFAFNDKTIQDALREVSEEIDCLILIDCGYDTSNKLVRTINAYDLKSVCLECGTRGNFDDECDKCGSKNISHGYGHDTNIFVSTENLADDIKFTTDTGSVKNCFRLEAGDDLTTAAVISCNPNGSEYLWNISDAMKDDMSDELVRLIDEYNEMYAYYQKEHSVVVEEALRTAYNNLIDKYSVFTQDYQKLGESIVGYPALMERYFDAIDFGVYLTSKLMPAPEMAETSAEKQIERIRTTLLSPVSVKNIATVSATTAESAVSGMAKAVVDSRYKITISESNFANNVWSGKITATSYANEDDTFTSDRITCRVDGNYEGYVKQKILKAIHQSVDDSVEVSNMFNLDNQVFANEMQKYCLSRLDAFHEICQTCVDILIEHGLADASKYSGLNEDLYNKVYLPYYNKLHIIEEEIIVRENEIAIVNGSFDNDGRVITRGMQTFIKEEADAIHSKLNFEEHLGEEYMLEFAAYRREDTYKNPNYVSDGLNNAELFRMALDFINVAQSEIIKSSTMQHSISAKLRNLLAMKEFALIVDSFELGNWIRTRTDGKLYKLRLIEYEIDFDNFDNIDVDFSDLVATRDSVSDIESIINQASSMASSYEYVTRQANKGEKSNSQLVDWVERGLDLTKLRIIDNADNQNISWDSHGLLCKEYLPISGKYDDKQLKIINRGLYLTDDGWKSSKAGIGDFTYWNPKTGRMEESYGVIADVIVGNIILSEDVGIYNQNNSITMNEDGFVITATPNDSDEAKNLLLVQREVEQDGVRKYEKLLYLDDNGYLVLNGTVRFQTPGATDPAKSFEDITKKIEEDIGGVVDRIDGFNGLFFYIRYSEFEDGKDMTEAPDANTKYIGTCNTDEKVAPTDPARYTWMKTKGDQGTHGIKGDDGTSQFLHIRYSDDGAKFTANGGKTLGDWIGTCVTQTDVAPTEFDAYQWSKFNGTDGINTAVLYLYKRDSINPGVFTKDLTYTFETGVLSGNLDGWTQTVPASDGNPCYMIQAIAASNEATDIVTSTEWSTPVLFVADGVTGENGYNTATVYLYKRSITDVTIDWTNDITYTFASKTLDRIPEGWTTTVPDELDIEGEALYVTAGAFVSKESTDTIAYTEWSAPVVLAKNGTNGTDGNNGTDGLNAATVFLYKRSASEPAKPTKTITYTFVDGSITDADGWLTSVPAGSNPCYIIQATAISREATDTIATSEWTAPVILAQNGSNGNNGRNNATVYLYKRSDTAATIGWTNSLTYTFSTGKLSSVPTGWSQNIPDGTAPLYVTAATASATGTTDSIAYTEWSTPVVLALNGKDGTNGSNGSNGVNGLNSATIFLYKRSATAPSKPTRDITYTFATGALSTTDGWSVTIPSGTDPCYVTQATAIANTDTDVIKATEWSAPEILAQNGADGNDGAHGMNTAVVYLYKRSTTGATVDWRTDLTYSFTSKAITSTAPTGWSKSIPDGTDPLYVTAATATSAESTDTIAYTEWSAPVVLAKNGTNGTDGLNSATVFLYKRSATTVTKPSKSITYTFSTGNMTDTDGWSKSVPDGTDPCYVVHATAISKDATDVIESSEWSSPALFVKNGANGSNGSNGNNTAIVYLYQRSKTALPVNWSTQLTYTFSTKRLTSVPTGWSQSIPSGTDPLYVTMATAYGNTDTDTIDSNQWCTPVMMAQNGVDGERGTSILAITTAPSSYTTAVDGITPAYRIALATVAEQSGVATPKVGDVIRQSYYDYPIIYIKGIYVYTRARVSVRGASSYTHIRYSEYADGSSMSATPTNTTVYIGVAVSTSSTAPTTASSYTWSKFRGNDGVPGAPGTDGRTQYLHIKYSNDGETFSPDDGEEIGTYIGTLVDFNQEDSMTFSDYKWKQFTGDLTVDMEEIQRRIDDSADAIYDTIDQKEQGLIDKIGDETGGIREAVGIELNAIRDTIKNNYDTAMAEATRVMNNYRAEVGQYMEFGNSGLVLGASSSSFKTVIDNQGMYFKEGDAIVSYVKNNQLHIPNAVIESTMALGNFFFSPRSDGGVSLVWQDGASS